MSLYLGLPVTCKEAFRLFSLNFEDIKCDIMKKYKLTENMYMDCYFIDYLNLFFKNERIVIKIFYTDKGQCIIGYEIEEVSIFQKKFISVDEFFIKISDLKKLFHTETNKYKENFSEVELEHMEDDPEIVSFPNPYIIQYNK
jgi:hypothetical protein